MINKKGAILGFFCFLFIAVFLSVPCRAEANGIPVLLYHSIGYEKGNDLRIPKEKFREQMQYLKDKGYATLTLDQLYFYLSNNTPIPKKSVVITFDDGYKDNYNSAYPILKEFGFKGTIFIITSAIDREKNFLTTKELKEMNDSGIIDIESHTVSHEKLTELPYDRQLSTLVQSKEYIEKLLNKKVYYLAYPYGKYNEDTIKAAKNAGYIMAFTTEYGFANNTQEMLKLKRVFVSGDYDLEYFKKQLGSN